jgi:ribosomal protein S18 acetylase RimI-like enzyme
MAIMPEPGPVPPGTPTIAVPLDGMVALAGGLLPSIVTFLELRAPPAVAPPGPPPATERLREGDVDRFRRLFVEVGGPWMWTSRLRHSDEQIAARLAETGINALAVLDEDGSDIGLVELDLRQHGEVEVVLFGFLPAAVGRGLGRRLMSDLLTRIWRRPGQRRVWLSTCTLDHPRALGFYRSFGFVAYRRAIEIGPDPRLDGLLAADLAPDWPLVR